MTDDTLPTLDYFDLPDVAPEPSERVCPTTWLTYNAGLGECPHHYDFSEACK